MRKHKGIKGMVESCLHPILNQQYLKYFEISLVSQLAYEEASAKRQLQGPMLRIVGDSAAQPFNVHIA